MSVIKFQSQATGDLVMVPKHAEVVLKLLGKSERGPGILEPKDMPAALAKLKSLPQEPDHAHKPEPQVDDDDEDVPEAPEPDFINESVSLRKRAWPLVTMIERALKEDQPIMWNVTI